MTSLPHLDKLETYDGVIEDLDPQAILNRFPAGFQLVFIDAEHTNEAVFSDFLHAYRLAADDSVIMLHDSWMMGSGLKNIICHLEFCGIRFFFRRIRDSVSAFFLGGYANLDRLSNEVHPDPFDQEAYFREINNTLWVSRKEEYTRDLPASVLLKQLNSLPASALVKNLAERGFSRIQKPRQSST